MSSKEPPLEHPKPEDAAPAMQTWRLLFLDCLENIETLKEAGKGAGYVVVGATTIEEAWAFLEGEDHVDVIVCAAHLEDESMFEFLDGVRASVHRDAMFLILSLQAGAAGSRLDQSTARAGLALGADAYLVQPSFDASELFDRIRSLRPTVPVLQQSADTTGSE